MSLKTALFISQEIAPYVAENPISCLGRNIPQSLQESGVEVRAFTPKYSQINERRNQLHEVIRLSGLNICISDVEHALVIKVATLLPTRMQVYFIDNDDFFPRQSDKSLAVYSLPDDNDERMIFFTRGVIETVRKLRWVPGVVACSGWVSALAPLYIRRRYGDDPTLRDSKLVYQIFDDSLPAPLAKRLIDNLKVDGFSDADIATVTSADEIDATTLGKLAIDFSDAVVQAAGYPNPALEEYARAAGKPFIVLDNEDPESRAQYKEFLASL